MDFFALVHQKMPSNKEIPHLIKLGKFFFRCFQAARITLGSLSEPTTSIDLATALLDR